MNATTHIKTLHERTNDEKGKPRRETWSLVDADGERKVLFEAHELGGSKEVAPIERKVMTPREALRGPPEVARKIWLALED